MEREKQTDVKVQSSICKLYNWCPGLHKEASPLGVQLWMLLTLCELLARTVSSFPAGSQALLGEGVHRKSRLRTVEFTRSRAWVGAHTGGRKWIQWEHSCLVLSHDMCLQSFRVELILTLLGGRVRMITSLSPEDPSYQHQTWGNHHPVHLPLPPDPFFSSPSCPPKPFPSVVSTHVVQSSFSLPRWSCFYLVKSPEVAQQLGLDSRKSRCGSPVVLSESTVSAAS